MNSIKDLGMGMEMSNPCRWRQEVVPQLSWWHPSSRLNHFRQSTARLATLTQRRNAAISSCWVCGAIESHFAQWDCIKGIWAHEGKEDQWCEHNVHGCHDLWHSGFSVANDGEAVDDSVGLMLTDKEVHCSKCESVTATALYIIGANLELKILSSLDYTHTHI